MSGLFCSLLKSKQSFEYMAHIDLSIGSTNYKIKYINTSLSILGSFIKKKYWAQVISSRKGPLAHVGRMNIYIITENII